MKDNFTQKSQDALKTAYETAGEYGNPEMTVEHLFHALLQDGDGLIFNVIKKMGENPNQIKEELNLIIQKMSKVSGGNDVYPSKAVSAVISFAQQFAKSLKDEFVSAFRLFPAKTLWWITPWRLPPRPPTTTKTILFARRRLKLVFTVRLTNPTRIYF
ncbi:MAG: hypothetical protein IKC64_05350 [Clostridia bacterium]|nr:hypothetical protein [Clostridia bacterium]